MVSHHLQYSFIYLFFSLSFIFICLFIATFPKRKHPYLLYFGLFLATISVNLIGIWQMPTGPTYSSLLKYTSYGASSFFFLFYEQIFGKGFNKINRRLWQLHLLCWSLIVLFSLFSIVRLEDTFFLYSILNMASILYVAIAAITKAHSGNNDAKIFTFGLVSLIVTLIFDISSAIIINNFAPSQSTTWGLLVFTGCLSAILLKRYVAEGTDFIYEPFTFHHDPIDLKMKADSMVLHTLKNEINHLLYLNERNKRLIPPIDVAIKGPLEKNFVAMDEALHHMNSMILAVKKTDDILLNIEESSLNAVISDAIRSFRTGLIHPNIQFDIDLSVSIDLEIDPLHIKECIINLLSNSVEAIEHPNGKIRIYLYRRNNDAILEVSDNGKGIHPGHLKDVITPLYTTKKSVSHYGVGLYYVYFVINKHEGSLSIPISELGKGTTFRIQLPVKKNKNPFWSVNAVGKNKSHAG